MTGWRNDKGTTAKRGYGGKWQRERAEYLRLHPLCRKCGDERPPRLSRATVVDHITAHRGDPKLFWDRKNWQPLCSTHHNSDKQREERGKQPLPRIGEDGYPLDTLAGGGKG